MSENHRAGKSATRAKNKYNANNYDSLRIVVPKGRKDAIEAHARAKGESVNGLVNALLRADMGLSDEEWKGKSDTPTPGEMRKGGGGGAITPSSTRQKQKDYHKTL